MYVYIYICVRVCIVDIIILKLCTASWFNSLHFFVTMLEE